MAQVYNKMQIDVNKRVAEIITAVQNDAQSRFLDVVLLDGSTAIDLTGHEVRIYGKKADGTEFYNDGAVTQAAAGRCQFELTGQALAVAQDLEVQLIVCKDNREILSTQPFKIHVVKSLIAAGAVESTNEYGALVVLYQKLYEAHALMTTMVQNIGVPGEVAKQLTIDTMWEAWEYLCGYVSEDLTALLQNAINNNSVDGVMQRIGKTADTGATETNGSVMGKLNRAINFNENYVEVQKLKSTVASVPYLVTSGTQNKVSFSVEFEKPVKFNYLQIVLSNMYGSYPYYTGIVATLKITYYDNTTRSVSLNGGRWHYKYYLYQSAMFDELCISYGENTPDNTLGIRTLPLSDTTFIKKVEILNGNLDDANNSKEGKATLNLYYMDKIKMW